MDYPWYSTVNEKDLEQGDILRDYPVFFNKPYKFPDDPHEGLPETEIEVMRADFIVTTQSCDLAHTKIDTVILCPIFKLEDIKSELGKNNKEINKKLESIRQGKEPGFHMLSNNDNPEIEFTIIVFKRIYTTPKETLEDFVEKVGNRIRLLPPYREHLSQAFARYFMRVGLPEDIPRFA